MEYSYYYVENKEGKSNCVIRSFCKLYNEKYDDVFNELLSISNLLKSKSFNDIEVFEEYMKRRNTIVINDNLDTKIKALNLDNGEYIVFCYDKKDYYHMITIINNVLFDKSDESLDLYPIKIYKRGKL